MIMITPFSIKSRNRYHFCLFIKRFSASLNLNQCITGKKLCTSNLIHGKNFSVLIIILNMKLLKTSMVQWCLDFEFFHGIRLRFPLKLILVPRFLKHTKFALLAFYQAIHKS